MGACNMICVGIKNGFCKTNRFSWPARNVTNLRPGSGEWGKTWPNEPATNQAIFAGGSIFCRTRAMIYEIVREMAIRFLCYQTWPKFASWVSSQRNPPINQQSGAKAFCTGGRYVSCVFPVPVYIANFFFCERGLRWWAFCWPNVTNGGQVGFCGNRMLN